MFGNELQQVGGFFSFPQFFSTNKTDRHDIIEILMKNSLFTMVSNQSKPIILPRLYGMSKALGNNLSMTAFLHI
jgi:hypothetical protein